MKRIAIIPVRSGSKGLKDKNILPLCGKPLLSYTIRQALESGEFDKIFVSTDSEKYARIARQYGAEVPFLRSEENSSDTAGSWDVVREVIHILEEQGERYDEIMLLQATSPLRAAQDIRQAIAFMHEKNANAVQSVTEMDHSPLWSNTLPDDLNMDSFESKEYGNLPRQLLPKYYRLNGAIYLIKREELDKQNMFCDKCYAYIMPQERSIDIDTEFDFKVAELYMKEDEKQ